MKNRKRTFQDIETLSAYLDDQLKPEEKARLQSRLQQESNLRQELESLRQTRAVLRHTPQVKRPRSFALTPEMVKEQNFFLRAMRVSRMVAVAASVLFAFVFAGQVFFGPMAGSIAFAPAKEAVTAYDQAADSAEFADMPDVMGGGGQEGEAPMAMQAVEEDSEMLAAEAPEEESMDMADTGLAPEEPQGTMMPAADEAQDTMDDSVMAEEETGIGGGGADNASEAAAEPAAEQLLPTATIVVEPRTSEADKTTAEEAAEAEVLSEELMEAAEPVGELPMPADQEADQVSSKWFDRIPVLVWVEGGLLVLAVLAGIFFLYFQRKLR